MVLLRRSLTPSWLQFLKRYDMSKDSHVAMLHKGSQYLLFPRPPSAESFSSRSLAPFARRSWRMSHRSPGRRYCLWALVVVPRYDVIESSSRRWHGWAVLALTIPFLTTCSAASTLGQTSKRPEQAENSSHFVDPGQSGLLHCPHASLSLAPLKQEVIVVESIATAAHRSDAQEPCAGGSDGREGCALGHGAPRWWGRRDWTRDGRCSSWFGYRLSLDRRRRHRFSQEVVPTRVS